MPRKRRRIRSPHPGVYLVPRRRKGARTAWRARYVDPDNGRVTWETLERLALPTPKAREIWAKRKAASLSKRRAELATGAARLSETPFADAVSAYFASARNRLRPATLKCYADSVELLHAWASSYGVLNVDDLAPPTLAQFREHLISRRRHRAKKGTCVGRGQHVETDHHVSPATINHHLRAVAAFLNRVRKLGLTPRLSRDSIAESLACLPTDRPLRQPLTPQECRQLVGAALRHDAVTFKKTRLEHAASPGAERVNRTPKFRAVAPLIALVLLTGCRIGEALNLKWADTVLDAPDDNGAIVGEVRLEATATKTKTARRVDLGVSPRLRLLLLALKLRAGGAPFVFGEAAPLAAHEAKNAVARLRNAYHAPPFSWQRLRQTCGSYLTNAPGIFGAASAYRSARQLGHSVTIAERFYVGVIRGIRRDAHTLDDAMQMTDALDALVAVTRGEASAVGRHSPTPLVTQRVAI